MSAWSIFADIFVGRETSFTSSAQGGGAIGYRTKVIPFGLRATSSREKRLFGVPDFASEHKSKAGTDGPAAMICLRNPTATSPRQLQTRLRKIIRGLHSHQGISADLELPLKAQRHVGTQAGMAV